MTTPAPSDATLDLRALACYGDTRQAQILRDDDEIRLVLFSLRAHQRVSGRGEPRAQLLCLEGEGALWAGDRRVEARHGTLLSCAPEERHGAEAGDGAFLVLGILAPSPRTMT